MPARNEEKTLPKCLEALKKQTLKIYKICIINDGSIDKTKQIAEAYGCQVIDLPLHPESYLARAETVWKIAEVSNYAFPPPPDCDYIMQHSPDTILPPNYVEALVERMEKNPRLVIASGVVRGEKTSKSHVRGVGRLYKSWFWNKYIKKFPLGLFSYESYPLFKARSLGLEVKNFPDLIMLTQRPTKAQMYLENQGYMMRELGYFPPFAIAHCLRVFLEDPNTGIKMLLSYLRPRISKTIENDVKNWVKLYQIHRILKFRVNET